jgi:hypothetical protein
MMIYYDSGKIPKNLLTSRGEFLFRLGEQGYKSDGGLKFGYYNDLTNLKGAVERYNIDPQDIHSFYYDRDNKTLINISASISGELGK